MKIHKVILHLGRMPVKVRFSYGVPREFSFVVARVFAGKHEGTGESVGGAHDNLEPLARSLIGQDVGRLDGLLGEAPYSCGPWPEFRSNVMRELLSMALYDLVARIHGIPFHLLLGGARRDRIPLMPCIFPESPGAAAETARYFLDQGFKSLKVKIFGDLPGDVKIIREIRRVMPAGFLQADANLGYKLPAQRRKVLTQLAEAGLTVAEDPFAATLDDYGIICAEFKAPLIMLDAPTRAWKGIHETTAKKAAHVVNLHPNMQGTFSEILGRAAVAKASGIPVMIGGTGYTGVGAFAHAQAASVLGLEFPYGEICGVRDHGMPESTSLPMLPVRDGEFHVTNEPGHGGRLNLPVIEKFSTQTMEFT